MDPPDNVPVIRLRLVEEYRGQRIVTNGEMYGVQGELITDCRYLDVAGARAAIDSELGIAKRKPDLEWQRERTTEYIAREGQDWAFACDCGWHGTYGELKKTGAPVFLSCPTCSSSCIMFSMSGDPAEPPLLTEKNRTSKRKKR